MSDRTKVRTRSFLWTVSWRLGFGVIVGYLAYALSLAYAPGSWFLSYSSATVTQTVFAGETVPVELCRERRVIGNVDATAHRTFYMSDEVNGTYVDVGGYDYSPDIEDTDGCVDIAIRPDRFKHEAGFYRFHTDLTFEVDGRQKTTGYDSNVYQVRPQPTTEELQRQIDELRRRQDEQRAVSSLRSADRSSALAISEQHSQSLTARSEQPTTSAPPERGSPAPSAPTQPRTPVVQSPSRPAEPQPSFVGRALQPVTTLIGGVL